MRVVQVNVAFDPRLATPDALLDAYHTLTGWSDALIDAGLSTSVVQAFSDDGSVQRRGVDYIFRRQRRSDPEAVLAAILAREPDVVHVNGFEAPDVARGLRRLLPASVPIVLQHHGGKPPRRLSPLGRSMRPTTNQADAFLFTSIAQAQPWIGRGYISPEAPVFDVPEASTLIAPVPRDEAHARTRLDGSPSFLWVGRLDTNKDPLTVLAGFEHALEMVPGAALTMLFGAEDLLGEVSRRIEASAKLRERVRLAGAVPHGEMAAWYSSADLFVLGSHDEGSGYALIEACACGATPVVTDIAPFRAITGDGSIGYHWRVGDADSCKSALVRAAAQLGNQSRSVVLDHFATSLSWTAVGRRARSIYEAVIARRTSRGQTAAC